VIESVGVGVTFERLKAEQFLVESRRHPAFRVVNLEALRRELEAAGIEIIAGNRFAGQECFFVRDP